MDNIIVKTKCGDVKGYKVNDVFKFQGIPFAEKPIRFKHSKELLNFDKLIDAKEPANSCYQFGPNFDGDSTPNESEDCLYLNVFTKETKTKKPVFVWIHGGGFMTGCSYYPMYDGTSFAKNDVVYVSINYRLGVFGFYDFHLLSEKFDENIGINDQIVALNWIKHNIEAFGGDLNNITICGESAGGISVLTLLASPITKGLYNKAIVESSLPYCIFSKEEAKIYVDAFLKVASIDEKHLDKLNDLKPKEIVELSHKAGELVYKDHPGFNIASPVCGTEILPYDIIEANKRKINDDVKLIIGTNRDEGTLFCQNTPYSMFPYGWDKVETMLKLTKHDNLLVDLKEYYDKTYKDYEFHQLAYDTLFLRGLLNVAEIRSVYSDVYVFRFDYSLPTTEKLKFKACHALEMSFVLGTTESMDDHHPFFKDGYDRIEVKKVEKQMNDAWINFVKNGDPNSDTLVVPWPKFTCDSKLAHTFKVEPSIISYKNYEPARLLGDIRIWTH